MCRTSWWPSRTDGGKNKDAVSKFLNFFYQTDNAANFQKEEGFLPVTKSAGDVISRRRPYYKPFVDALPNAKFYPTGNAAWGPLANTVKEKHRHGASPRRTRRAS